MGDQRMRRSLWLQSKRAAGAVCKSMKGHIVLTKLGQGAGGGGSTLLFECVFLYVYVVARNQYMDT